MEEISEDLLSESIYIIVHIPTGNVTATFKCRGANAAFEICKINKYRLDKNHRLFIGVGSDKWES